MTHGNEPAFRPLIKSFRIRFSILVILDTPIAQPNSLAKAYTLSQLL
jgi:hypothetical protein